MFQSGCGVVVTSNGSRLNSMKYCLIVITLITIMSTIIVTLYLLYYTHVFHFGKIIPSARPNPGNNDKNNKKNNNNNNDNSNDSNKNRNRKDTKKNNVEEFGHCPALCRKYMVRNTTWPKNWGHEFSNVPTSRMPKTSKVISALKRQRENIKLSKDDNKTLSDYHRCEHLQTKLPCDDECLRFRALLAVWPKDKPKGAIYFLAHRLSKHYLEDALPRLDLYFNNQFQYPVIFFTEPESVNRTEVMKFVHKHSNSSAFFQDVIFRIPPHIHGTDFPLKVCRQPTGYRHMCRFHSKEVYRQPILDGLDYLWRLDDDSELSHPFSYDIFKFMQDNNYSYGYYYRVMDPCVELLWEVSCKYVCEEYVRTEFFDNWRVGQVFYNNFEISDLSVWRSCAYWNYVDYIDRLGGIFYYHWGDAQIHSIGLSLTTPWNKLHHFKDIGYWHSGRGSDLAKKLGPRRKNRSGIPS